LFSRATDTRCHTAGFEVVAVYGSSPIIDGVIDVEEWTDAEMIYFGCTQTFVKQDGINLYGGFNVSLSKLGNLTYVAMFCDVNHDAGPTLQADDFVIAIFRDGTLLEQNVTNGNWNPNPTNVSGWTAKANSTADIWQAEFNITYSKINVTAGIAKTIGVMFSICKTPSVHYYWPSPTSAYSPSTWGDITSTGYDWIPEFCSLAILPLFMIATLLASTAYKRKMPLRTLKKCWSRLLC
jgi:hypothetical protein